MGTAMPANPTTWLISGQVAIDRAGVAQRTGAGHSTVRLWYRTRTVTGFPEPIPAPVIRAALSTTPGAGADLADRAWWWAADIDAFHAEHQAAKLAELTRVDRHGDPDELVTSGVAAQILGYRSYRNLPQALTDQPDWTDELSDGRRRRYWYRRTVWAVADARTGRQSTGRPVGATTGPRKPHPYADDPRLDTARALLTQADGKPRRHLVAELVDQLGIAPKTARRLLAAAAFTDPASPAAEPSVPPAPGAPPLAARTGP
jgi:hypothetical protein